MRLIDLINTRIDERVTATERNAIAIDLLQKGEAYTARKDLFGNKIYSWNPLFIDKINEALLTNIQPKFSIPQQKLFDEYMLRLLNGASVNDSADLVALDAYMSGGIV